MGYRTSIYIQDATETFLGSGAVRAPNFSERIGRVVDRYTTMVSELFPSRVSAADWSKIVFVVADMTLAKPADVVGIAARLKTINKQRHPIGDVSQLTYRLSDMSLPELIAVVDVAERLIHANCRTPEEIAVWLSDHQYPAGA